jgi:hypothetical protein
MDQLLCCRQIAGAGLLACVEAKIMMGIENGFIEIKKDSIGVWTVYSKQYLNCDNEVK